MRCQWHHLPASLSADQKCRNVESLETEVMWCEPDNFTVITLNLCSDIYSKYFSYSSQRGTCQHQKLTFPNLMNDFPNLNKSNVRHFDLKRTVDIIPDLCACLSRPLVTCHIFQTVSTDQSLSHGVRVWGELSWYNRGKKYIEMERKYENCTNTEP